MSLAEYSFALKATVGLNALVLAVALWELVTGSKIEQTLPWRPQIRFFLLFFLFLFLFLLLDADLLCLILQCFKRVLHRLVALLKPID